jgi:hypothetical protein
MSSENVWFIAIGALLFVLNAVLGGPLSVRIARFFARASTPEAQGLKAKTPRTGREGPQNHRIADARAQAVRPNRAA